MYLSCGLIRFLRRRGDLILKVHNFFKGSEVNIRLRYSVIKTVILISALVIAGRLVQMQAVQGETYKEMSEKRLIKSIQVKAPRGEFFDRYGNPIVSNKMGFSILFQKELIEPENLDRLILDSISVVLGSGDTYIDNFPLEFKKPFKFTYSGKDADEKIKKFKSDNNIPETFSGSDIISFFKTKYNISDEYSEEDLRKIAGVRYEMANRLFSNKTPYVFASNVSLQSITVFKELGDYYKGITIIDEPVREYNHPGLASHILGRVGMISKTEYDSLKSDGYKINDTIGKDGLEKQYESYLRGKDGSYSIQQNVVTKTTQIIENETAQSGNYLVLTIDLELQKTLESSLEKVIKDIKSSGIARDASNGAGVVLDVRNGDVLAMASYPTFDLSHFNEDFEKLNSDPLTPMYNRAISGTYAPGSTFKMVTAIAALEENVIGVNDKILDEGRYNYYSNSTYKPVCWIYSDTGRTHGYVNVTDALKTSCNYFFYEVGRRLTIDNIQKYGKLFGLGEYTGISLQGESKGILASKEERSERGLSWYPGDTIQAAIGQSDHLFTPLQLANYVATLANGGTRYRPNLVKSIKSYDGTKSIDFAPEVLSEFDISDKNYKAVIDGMAAASSEGTASAVFSGYSQKVASKTGTASVPSGTANGIFVAFAPADDPQIAVAIVVEHGAHGNSVAPAAKQVFDAYFKIKSVEDNISKANDLLE